MNESDSDQKYRPRRRKPADVVQGSIELLVLSALSKKSLKQSAIHSEIKRLSGGVFNPSRGSLFTALKRLQDKGCLKDSFRKSITGHLTHYQLTSAGKELLAKCRKDWRRAINGIEHFLEPELDSTKFRLALNVFQQAGAILRRHSAKVPFLSPWASVLEQVEKISKKVNSTRGLRKFTSFGSDYDQEQI